MKAKKSYFITIPCFVIFFILIPSFLLIQFFKSSFIKAKFTSDANTQASYYAQDVRDGGKSALNSIRYLCEIDNDSAFYQMISLMDVPDSAYLSSSQREYLWRQINIRSKNITSSVPDYSPNASVEVRSQQKKLWLDWYDQNIKKKN